MAMVAPTMGEGREGGKVETQQSNGKTTLILNNVHFRQANLACNGASHTWMDINHKNWQKIIAGSFLSSRAKIIDQNQRERRRFKLSTWPAWSKENQPPASVR